MCVDKLRLCTLDEHKLFTNTIMILNVNYADGTLGHDENLNIVLTAQNMWETCKNVQICELVTFA